MEKIQVREIARAEYPVLEDFLYNAIFIPKGEEYPSREIIFEPEIYIYVKDFGFDTDCGVIAERDGTIIGAAWTRIIPAYGHIDDDTPELAISVLPIERGQGVGTLLMNRLFELLQARGYKRTSLSVQQNNPAVRFYKRLGYRITDEKLDHAGHEDYIMVKQHLLFRDALCTNPSAISKYDALKAALAAKRGNDIDAYIDGKAEFIHGILEGEV